MRPKKPITRFFQVDGGRTDNYTSDGTFEFPYKTVQSAITAAQDSGTRAHIRVMPGDYTENLTVTYDWFMTIELVSAHVIGTLAWSISGSATAFKPKLIIKGADARPAFPTGTAYILNGIQGNVSVTQVSGASVSPILEFIQSGVVGNIAFSGPTGNVMNLFLADATYTGNVTSTSTTGPQVLVFAKNSMFGSLSSIGGAVGQVSLVEGHNIRMTAAWTIETPLNNAGGTWTHVIWKTGSNFTTNSRPYSGSYSMDSMSYTSYVNNVTQKGSEIAIALEGTFSPVALAASGLSTFNVSGTAPSNPVAGDVWVDTSGSITLLTTTPNTLTALMRDIVCSSASPMTVNLPTASASLVGQLFIVKNIGAGSVTLQGDVNIDASASIALAQWKSYMVRLVDTTGGGVYKWIIIATF